MSIKDSESLVQLISSVLFLIAGTAKCCEIYSTSPTCDHFQQLQRSLDQSVDPCEDFYAHACNNWPMEHSSTEYNTIVGEVDYQMNLKLITVMESFNQEPLSTIHQNVFNKSYIYYKSCVNEKVRNISLYLEIIKPGQGLEWPMIEELQAYLRGDTDFQVKEWPAGQFNLFALLGKLHGHGLNSVLIHQSMNRTANGIEFILGRPSVGRPSDWRKQKVLSHPLLTKLIRDIGLPENIAQHYSENIKNTEKYIHAMYRRFIRSVRSDHPTYTNLTLQYPALAVFVQNILPLHTQDNDIQPIQLYFVDYLEFLMNKQWSAREEQDLCNYLMVIFLIHVVGDKTNNLTKLECVKDVRNDMDFPINLLYYQDIFMPVQSNYNGDITTLTNKARDYLVEALRENHLNFTEQYLDQWQTELSAIALKLGNMPEHLHTFRIEESFRDLPDLVLTNYYENHLHVLRHRVLKSLHMYKTETHSPITGERVGSSSKPFCDVDRRMMIIPLGILQPPIYHHTYDPIFKWSMLGFQLVHDFTHAIIRSLLRPNAESYLYCSKQRGRNTDSDGMPNLVAARVAYRAYIDQQNFQLYPQFSKANWKKLFFLNLAQYFCVRQDVQLRATYADRLKYVVMNLESFAEAFECPAGTQMNPKEKCRFF